MWNIKCIYPIFKECNEGLSSQQTSVNNTTAADSVSTKIKILLAIYIKITNYTKIGVSTTGK